jgi:hypothetical protein
MQHETKRISARLMVFKNAALPVNIPVYQHNRNLFAFIFIRIGVDLSSNIIEKVSTSEEIYLRFRIVPSPMSVRKTSWTKRFPDWFRQQLMIQNERKNNVFFIFMEIKKIQIFICYIKNKADFLPECTLIETGSVRAQHNTWYRVVGTLTKRARFDITYTILRGVHDQCTKGSKSVQNTTS